MGPSGKEPGLTYEFSYTAQLSPPIACVPGHNGTRFLVEATQGRVEGVNEAVMGVFETGDERYAWLTQSVFFGAGRFPGDLVVGYDVYRVG